MGKKKRKEGSNGIITADKDVADGHDEDSGNGAATADKDVVDGHEDDEAVPQTDPEKIKELEAKIEEIKTRLRHEMKTAGEARREGYHEDYEALICSDEPVSNSREWGRRGCTVCGRIR